MRFLFLLIVWFGLAAAWAGEPAPLAAATAPDGVGDWLAIVAFLLGIVHFAKNIFFPSRMPVPLEVAETKKFATADAFSRHCTEQKADLRRIQEDSADATKEVGQQLHELSREVTDIGGRSEINTKRMERLENKVDEILTRLPRKT